MDIILGSQFKFLSIPLMFLIGGMECGIGADVKPDGAATYRMHHQLNMRGPHHPRSSEAAHVSHEHHQPHYQLHRPPESEGSHSVPKITQDTNLLRDAEHIREDLENLIPSEDTKKMSPEELEFYYFKLHDFDNNTKLDGLEILQAIQHVMHNEDSSEHNTNAEQDQNQVTNEEINTQTTTTTEETERLEDDFAYFVELIDKVLEEDDLDHDGFLSYVEYVQGRKKDQIKREDKHRKP